MNFFKIVIMSFCAVFLYTSILCAQTFISNETDFGMELKGANQTPNLTINNSISFTDQANLPTVTNKNIRINLSQGVKLDAAQNANIQGFNVSASTLSITGSGTGADISSFKRAVNATNSIVNLSGNLTFAQNASNGNGGAVLLSNSSKLVFNGGGNITFRQNSSDVSGGAIYLSGASAASFTADNIVFNLNKSKESGGAVYLTDNSLFDLTASTTLFRNNSSNKHAGAIYATSGSTVNFAGTFIEFSGNSSRYSGGALYGASNSYFSFDADTVIFDNNSSKDSDLQNAVGGIAYAEKAKFDFNGQKAYFQNNNAFGGGGAFFAGNESVFTFNSSTNIFSGNESGAYGGAIHSESDSKFIFNGNETYFDINKAQANGGAIDAVGGSELTFASLKTYFSYNEAANGGAIHGNSSSFTFNGDEVVFMGNKGTSSGGALYAENKAVFDILSASAVFRNNNSGNNGGAIYMADSSITIDNAVFLNNKASGLGGAIYMNGISSAESADLNIRALQSDVLFSGNTASGAANDIYMNKYANIEFNAAAGKKIVIDGGISGSNTGNSINKTGTGILEFYGNHSNYKGDLKISAGVLAVKNDVAVAAGKFEIDNGAKYSTVNGYGNQVTRVGDAYIKGEFEIDLDVVAYKADKLVADSILTTNTAGKVDLDATTSSLNLVVGGTLGLGTTRITILEAENGITGTFSNSAAINTYLATLLPLTADIYLEYFANRVDVFISHKSSFYTLTGMTHNQSEIASSLDEISKTTTTAEMSALITKVDAMANQNMKKSAFDELSGAFIANALTAGALRNAMTELYSRMQPEFCPKTGKMIGSVWGQIYLVNNRYDESKNFTGDFSVNGYGIQAGADLLKAERSLAGLYVSYGINNLEQGSDKGDMQDYGLGFYGGWFGENIDLKGSLGAGMQDFDLERNIKFAGLRTSSVFNTYSIRADGQAEYKIGLNGTLELRPFIGFQGGYVMSEKIEEKNGKGANLIIDSGDYLRLTGLGGIGISNRLEKLNWYGKLYAGYLIEGNKVEFEGAFADYGNKMDIWGAEVGEISGGASIGAEYNLSKQWSVYTNINAAYSDKTSGYYGNIGINYNFCPDMLRAGSKDKGIKISPDKKAKKERAKEVAPYIKSKKTDKEEYITYDDKIVKFEEVSSFEPAAKPQIFTQDTSSGTETAEQSKAAKVSEKAAKKEYPVVAKEAKKDKDYPVGAKAAQQETNIYESAVAVSASAEQSKVSAAKKEESIYETDKAEPVKRESSAEKKAEPKGTAAATTVAEASLTSFGEIVKAEKLAPAEIVKPSEKAESRGTASSGFESKPVEKAAVVKPAEKIETAEQTKAAQKVKPIKQAEPVEKRTIAASKIEDAGYESYEPEIVEKAEQVEPTQTVSEPAKSAQKVKPVKQAEPAAQAKPVEKAAIVKPAEKVKTAEQSKAVKVSEKAEKKEYPVVAKGAKKDKDYPVGAKAAQQETNIYESAVAVSASAEQSKVSAAKKEKKMDESGVISEKRKMPATKIESLAHKAEPAEVVLPASLSADKKIVRKSVASFAPSGYKLNAAEKEEIKHQAEEIKRAGYDKIVVRGHTDSTGSDAVNNRLSLQRAKAVYEELISSGIEVDKIEFVGYGARKPLDRSAAKENMALNRRVDIVVDEDAITSGVVYIASHFVTNAYNLEEATKEKIKNQTEIINKISYKKIVVEGHADLTGNDFINDSLSKRRARTIYDEFIKNGIPQEKMTYIGHGSKTPVDTNKTRKGRANNRRVDIIVD